MDHTYDTCMQEFDDLYAMLQIFYGREKNICFLLNIDGELLAPLLVIEGCFCPHVQVINEFTVENSCHALGKFANKTFAEIFQLLANIGVC